MKLLFVTTEIGMDGGGLSLSCKKLAKLLSADNEIEIVDSTQVYNLTCSGGLYPELEHSIQLEYKLKTERNKYEGVDYVIGFGGKFNGYYAALLAESLHASFILSLRGSDINISKWSISDSWYLNNAVIRAKTIVCLSKEMVNNVLLTCPSVSDRIVIIPNTVEGNFISTLLPNIPKTVVLGCAATHLNEKKGIANLLSMVSEFKKISHIPIKVELVGDIDADLLNSYKLLINNLGIKDNVLFYHKTTRESLIEKMRNWDFYVQASVCEGHPNAITEALQNGCGFISTKTGYIAELLSERFPELFFNDYDPTSMAISLANLITCSNKRTIFQNAYEILKYNCSPSAIMRSWNRVFEKASVNYSKRMDIAHITAVGLHDVQGEQHDSITTPISVFEAFVEHVHALGYGLCSMREFLLKDSANRDAWIVCTFDDGYEGLIDYALPILEKYGYTATVFICTSLIGKNNKWNNKDSVLREHLSMEQLDILHQQGWEIASHGVSHTNLLKLSDKELDQELHQSLTDISRRWGKTLTYAYPYGTYNEFVKKCVSKYYKYAFAVTSGGTSLIADSLQIRRYSISEIYNMISEKQ